MSVYIYYKVGNKKAKVQSDKQAEFEKKYPDAKIYYTYGGRNAAVPISNRDAFLSKYGAENITYSTFDDNWQYSPDLSTRRYLESGISDVQEEADTTNKKPKRSKFSDWVVAANDSLMRAQHGSALSQAEAAMAKATEASPEIDRDMADMLIESHRVNKSRIDEYIAEQDKTGYDYDPTKMTGSIPMPAIGLANNMYMQSKKAQKTKGQDYTDALIAQRLHEKVEDTIEQYLDPSKTFLTGAAEGIKDTAFDIDTWDSGMAAEDAARVYAISKKLDNGGELTDGEQMIVDALVDELASKTYLAAEFGRGYKAGKVTGESLPFIVETMLNPASRFGSSVTKKFGKEIFKRVGRKLGAKAARAAVYGTRISADIAGAAMMSATTSQAKVAADALDRLSGQVDFTINDDGTFDFNGFVGGEDSVFKAYAKAYGANTIEHFSEMIGYYFAPMGQMARGVFAARANKVGLKKVSQLLTEMTPNGFGSLVNDFAGRTQWHGIIGEFAEEMIGGAMNALVVGDQTLKKYDDNGNINGNYLFEKDNVIDTFLGVSIIGGVMSSAKTVGYTTPETRYNREISKARKALEGKISAEEIKQLEAFAENPMGADYANLRPFFEESRDEESKKAVAGYLKAVMEKQGYNIAREADLSGTKQGMDEMQNAYRVGNSMTEADLYDVNEAESQAMQALTETGFFNRMAEQGYVFTEDEVSGYSSYDIFSVSEKNDINLSEEERTALRNLAIAKNVKEGLNNRLNAVSQTVITTNEAIANESAVDGVITVGIHNGKTVYVKGGVQVSNGSIVKPSDGAYPIEIVDSTTGEKSVVDSGELAQVATVGLDVYNSQMSEVISTYFQQRWDEWQNKKSVKSKLAEIEKLVGQSLYIDTGNGAMTEIEIQQILPNGEVVIKGKKGDLGGQSTIRVDVDSLYDSMTRDANGNPIFNQSKFRSQSAGIEAARNSMYVQGNNARDARKPQQEQEATTGTEAPQTPVEPADFRDFTDTIIFNDNPIKIDEVTAQDDVSDSITFIYTDENGVQRIGNMTIGAFAEAVNLGRQQTETPAPAPSAEGEIGVPSPVSTETPATQQTPIDTTPEVTEEPAPQEEPVQVQLAPEDIDWDALFNQDPEGYFAEIQNQYGEEAIDVLNEEIEAAQSELDSLGKAKTKSQNERAKNRKRKAELQSRIESLNGMVARLAPAVVEETPQAVTETPTDVVEEPVPAQTELTDTTPTTEVVEEPLPVEDVPVSETPGPAPIEETPTETPVTEVPTEPQPTTPVAPNPVDNPAQAAKDREAELMKLLERRGVNKNVKRDSAFNAGRQVADMFATREDYDAYLEVAEDLGEFLADFNRGVEESFADRERSDRGIKQYHIGNEAESKSGDLELGEMVTGWMREGGVEVRSIENEQESEDSDAAQYAKKGTSKALPASRKKSAPTLVNENSSANVDISFQRKKVIESLNELLEEIKKQPKDYLTFLKRIKLALGASVEIANNPDKTLYAENNIDNSTHTHRVANHASNALTFAERDRFDNNSAVVIKMSDKRFRGSGKVNLIDYVYYPDLLSGEKQIGIIHGIVDWVNTGEYSDTNYDNKHESTIRENQLETSSGVVYGYVEDGIVHLDYSLMNPNTPIHEYTHLWDNALMQLNPALWEKGKALMKKTSLWNEVINDPNYADIKDNEDLVASEVHSRLVGTKGAARLEQLEQEARAKGLTKGAKELSILGRLREWLNEATQWLKDAFSGTWSKEDLDKVTLTDFLNMPLRDLANFRTLPKVETGVVTNENGDVIADNNGNGHIQFSIKTWREGGRDYLASWLGEDNTLSEDEKADILARMDEFYENAQKYTDVYVPFGTWSEASVKYDKDGNPLMSVIKANGDYAMNLDFSLVCKKRRPLNLLLRELINRNAFGTYTLRERELAEINWILQEHGFEVACALCFVDSKRYRVTGVADVFATLYNRFVRALAPDGAQIAHFNYSNNPNVEAVENGIDTLPDEQLNWKKFDELAKKYGPKTVEGKVARFLRENPSQRRLVDATDFIDAKGFEAVKEGNPALLSLYNSKKGTGGPKASFGDVQYLNDILKRDKAFDVEKAYSVGGVRLQSFSDFVPHMYFDYMQLFAELAAKNLPAHAYTKEVLFAKIFGMTGLKINMSLVPSVVEGGIAPGLDSEGNYTWADAIKDKDGNVIQQAQSFPFDEAMAIQNAEGYSKNCGVIAVGISDEHIEKMLDDPNIPYIIPYHKSSLNAIVARMTNIDQYKDYTKVQNTRKANGSKLPKGTPDFNFNAYLHENPNATPQDAAQAYLDWCKKNKYKPKFSQFAYHPNYYKLLQDFNTMDTTTGEYAPQGPVTMTFPTEQNAFGNVETLIQQGLKEDAELEEKFETDIKAVADEVEQRLEEIKAEPQLTGKKYEQHLDKIVGDRMAKIKKMSEATADEYGDGILSRSGDITPEMDAEYLAAVERGDMETAQRMVNEAADKYLNETLLPNDEDEVGFKYHRGPAPAKTFKRYAVLNVTPEGFKAAYAGNKTGTPVGVWLDAQNLASYTSDTVQFDDGTFATYIAGDTGAATNTKFSPERAEELGVKGGQRWLLERGGKHSSDVPNFSQMNLKVNENGEKVSSAKDGALPHNKLIFEIEYGISEEGDLTDYVRENGRMMKGKNQGLAKIGPNQYYDFKTNPNAVGNWGIGGTFRITRLVPHSEVVSVTEQYKKDAIAEANRLYEKGEISKKDRDARVKSAESIQVQKWVGGYNPADFGLSEEIVKQMVEEGSKMKLTDPVTYDDAGNVIPLSERFNPEKRDIRYRKSDIQNAATDYLAGSQRTELIQRAVNEEAQKLGVTVTYKTREEMPNGHKNDKGYYNTKTGEIVVCTENNADINDAIKTILHEAVAHKGLRNLMGDRFNEFINRVYESLDAETKEKVDALADKSYNGNKMVAMEEYMASLAETEDFAKTSVWDKIKDIFNRIINSILGRNDIKIGDNELRYILRASYANMVNPRNMETIDGWANDTNMRNELGINNDAPEIMSRTGIDDISFTTAREAYETVTFNGFTEIMKSIQNATGFKGKIKAIKTGLLKIWNEYQMENQDAQQAVITGIEAIQKETGNIPVEDFENYLRVENQMQSRSAEEIESFLNNQFAAVVDQINDIITSVMMARGVKHRNKKQRASVYNEVRQYLIAKHGLERNMYYQNSTGEMRDYSGLTALFGLPQTEFALAETMAQDMVDKFEAEIGDVARDDLWKKINVATRKTLRHAFESGLLSRSQHDKIRDMFDFYIPLRGFDETTAEDVYNYANYDGNRFQPAVREAHGRSSLAFDPIAVIMNMAQSEIVHGNKNRVKQALYHYIGNRPNSLLTPRECWYVLDRATGAFVEAYPDIANGETWEQFEIRMQALEATGGAMKQKRGLDVGYRFQKPTNKDQHYIHLKINGVEHAIYVNGNPRLAEGVNGFARKKDGEDIIASVKKANRWASQLFTNYNYKFGGKNFFRDFIWAQTVMLIKENPLYNIRFAGNWFANNPIIVGSLMRKFKSGTLDMTNKNHVLFKEFVENGGKTGYVFIDALDRQKRRIDKAIERISNIGSTKTNALTKAAVLFEVINYANECIELTARFSTYVTSRNTKDKSGNVRSITQSIDDAKSITTNFNRKGAQSGRGFIGGVANFMGSWNFFYNAAVQGVQQVKGLNNKHPFKTKLVLGGWVALGFLMPYIIDILMGDDDDEVYWNLPEYERKNNICVPFGKGKVTMTIPLSPIIREGYAIGVTLSDAMFNKSVDKDATMLSMECASLLAKALLPANPVEGIDAGLTPAENLLMFGTPDIADPIVETVINKDWTGTPIENRTTYNEGAPHYTKVIGKDNWKERVGEKLYKAGEDNLDSSLDINLSAWEHIFSSGAGGLGAFAKDITNIIDWVIEWKAPERFNDIPVARTLISSNAMDDEKFVNDIYWDMDDVYKKKTKVISTVYGLTPTEAFKKEEGKGNANLVKVYEAKSYPFLKKYYELNKDITKKFEDIKKMPTETEDEKNKKASAEQELFNMRRDLVYELLKYEIE